MEEQLRGLDLNQSTAPAPAPSASPSASPKDKDSSSCCSSSCCSAVWKRELVRWLGSEVYVKLGVSDIEGVGVIAIRDIPKGTNPFTSCNEGLLRRETMVTLTETEVREVSRRAGSTAVLELIKSFFAPLTEECNRTGMEREATTASGDLLYGVNATGTNTLDVSWYLNHSDRPNIQFVECAEENGFNTYVAKDTIRQGTELTVDYREMGKVYHQHATAAGPRRSEEDTIKRATTDDDDSLEKEKK